MDKKMVKKMGEKKIFIAMLLFMLNTQVITYAISDEELYLQGNSFYLQGDYDKALSRYQTMKRKGPAVFHNMGNCHSYLGHPVDALISWRQAQWGAGYKEFDELERVIAQEKHTYTQDSNRIEDNKIDKHNFWAYAQRLFVPYSLLWLQIIFLFFWLILFMLFYQKKSWWLSLTGSGTRVSRTVTGEARRATSWFTSLLYLCILGCMIFLELALGVGMWLKNKEQQCQRAVVTRDRAQLHAGPERKFKIVAEVVFLDELLVEESSKDVKKEKWYKVREERKVVDKKNGRIQKGGWVEEANIRIINESK